jgi:hypothetical protein
MTGLHIDYTRTDAARRMKLLEMAGGDLKRAMELERWVQCGFTMPSSAPVAASAEDFSAPAGAGPFAPQHTGDTHGSNDAEVRMLEAGESGQHPAGRLDGDRDGGTEILRLRDREDTEASREGEGQEVSGANESCGGVESRHAGPGDQIAVHGEAGERTGPERFAVGQAGVAPGPQDPIAIPALLKRERVRG